MIPKRKANTWPRTQWLDVRSRRHKIVRIIYSLVIEIEHNYTIPKHRRATINTHINCAWSPPPNGKPNGTNSRNQIEVMSIRCANENQINNHKLMHEKQRKLKMPKLTKIILLSFINILLLFFSHTKALSIIVGRKKIEIKQFKSIIFINIILFLFLFDWLSCVWMRGFRVVKTYIYSPKNHNKNLSSIKCFWSMYQCSE